MSDPGRQRKRFRFGEFVLSPSTRSLTRGGRPVPMIPRYLDLLILLVERREVALTRDEIMERVWSDVVVSDGALSQAVRTLRRALGDDPRAQRFIRTVSRHGYQFVCPDPIEEDAAVEATGATTAASTPDRHAASEGAGPAGPAAAMEALAAGPRVPGSSRRRIGPPSAPPNDQARRADVLEARRGLGTSGGDPLAEASDPFGEQIARLLAPEASGGSHEEDSAREAAERLHELGTAEALARLGERPGHEKARAILRDVRWEVPGAGDVPLLGRPGGLASLRFLARMRIRRAARLVRARWLSAAAGGALAGIAAGWIGGLGIDFASGGQARGNLPLIFSVVGAVVGGLGAAGVAAGLSVAEAVTRSWRTPALILLGAAGGGAIGFAAHVVGRMVLEGLFGGDLSLVGGAFEGVFMGGAAGAGYGFATPRPEGGMAAPRGRSRLLAASATGLACASAGVAISWMGGHLGGVSLDVMAHAFRGSQVGLEPLAHLFGETGLGPLTRGVLGAYEGLFFGTGLVAGLTRRPRPHR